ncbi:MAG: peptide ABC transporter substrate-binding protein [Paenibacillaceae bacterium]|nr:peptide ABC transporter substrate-binding protein [Paenibacillaceae bacterium]
MLWKKGVTAALALAVIGTAAVGCGKNKEEGATGNAGGKAPAQEMKINFSAEPPVLDTSKANSSAAFTFINAIGESLYRLDRENKAQPALAKELPQISADGLTYTIALRDGLVWADGSPLTAQDFVYSYQRTLDPTTKASYAFLLQWIKGGAAVTAAKTPDEVAAKQKELGVVAKDDKTLVITLEKPVPFFTQMLAFCTFFPQKKDFIEPLGEKNGADADKVIGAGPFKLVSWTHDQTMEFVKNDKYWDAANVKLEKFTVNIVKDTNLGLNLYETGGATLTEIKADQIKLYEGKPDTTLKPELTSSYITFQETKMPAFKNAKVRQAIGLAIDRKGLVDSTLANGSVPSTGYVPVGTLDGNGNDFRKTVGDTQEMVNVDKAKQLLADGLKELNMPALPKLTITSDDTETAKKSLEYIVSQLQTNLKLDVQAEPVPHALRVEKEMSKNYVMVLSLWGADYNDPMTFLDMFTTGSAFNYGDYSNATYDGLIRSADTERDPAKRAQELADAEKLLMKEAGIFPLYFRSKVYLKKPNIDGVILPSYGMEFELRWANVK